MQLPALPSYQWTFRRVMGATLVLVLVALGFWLLYRYDQVVLSVLIALVLGTVPLFSFCSIGLPFSQSHWRR
jgi:hypothetical protein